MNLINCRSLVRIPFLRPSPLQRYQAAAGRRRVVEGEYLLISDCGPGPENNFAMAFNAEDANQFYDAASGFFGSDAYAVTVESDCATPVEAYLQSQGWLMVEEEPAMLLTPIPTLPPLNSGIAIRPVTTPERFADFMLVAPETIDWVPSLDAALGPDVALLVGYVDEIPVATARLTCFDSVGEITGIVTRSDYRRRGIGTAMTWAVIDAAVQRGCTAITLTATPMGYPVYRRMGFVPICTYRTYLPPEESGPSCST